MKASVTQDGLGRPLQDVQVSASPDGGSDLIQPYVYGRGGRVEKSFLPYAGLGNLGNFDAGFSAASNWSIYGASEQSHAFSVTEYDGSPSNRVTKRTGPGSAWHTAGKGVTTAYGYNGADEVRLYRVSSDGGLVCGGYYAAGRLEKTTVTDEDGLVTESFTDNEGKTILTVSLNGTDRLETYSVYDALGRVRWVLPPEASYRLGAGTDATVLSRYAYRYDYDPRGLLTAKRLPGVEPVYYVYDGKDRAVLSQDGNQRSGNRWSYTLYDSQNRATETGEVVLPGKTVSQLRSEACVSKNYLPSGTRIALQYSLYDSYTASATVTPHAFVSTPAYASAYHPLVTGCLTATKTRILGSDTWQTTTLYYDDRGRVIQTVSDNRLGGLSRTDMQYDFIGNLTHQRESHGKAGGGADVLESVNTYDAQGRLLTQSVKLNNGVAATLTYSYDALGRLIGKRYGSTDESLTYNVRGWLTGKESTPFRMRLRYETSEGGSAARWNGSLSEWEWQHGANPAMQYGFTYDGLNRFTGAEQKQKNGNTWSALPGDYVEKGLTYDRNGNLLTLQRTAGGSVVDNLAYTYTGNQLTGLSESVRTAPSNDIYAPGSAASGSYSYDANGNLQNDSRRSLIIDYNVLNLVSEVRTGGTLTAAYTWLADGTKLGVRTGNGSDGFEYVGSLIYRKSGGGLQLSEALFGDGVIRLNDNGTQEVDYFLTDHLGSVRVIVDASGTVKERNDYYPFGARHIRSDYAQSTNRWKYNGKELQTTGELGCLDYGARMYDAGLGRWFCADPAGEEYFSYSPYHFSGNNPLVYVDSDGRMMDWYSNESGSAIFWRDTKEKKLEINGEIYHNIGNTISFDIGGLFLNYYQNILISTSTKEVDVMSSLLNNSTLLSKLLGSNSPLSETNQLELLINSIQKAQRDFLNHPITQATINTLTFVATGGIEGIVSLGNVGQSFLSSIKTGGKGFAQYRVARGGTKTLAKIMTSTGEQRISTEFHHVFISQRIQNAYNLPNWLVNNRINVWKLNTIQHALLDSYRFRFLRAGIKSEVGWFKQYNWFTKF